MDDDGDDKDDTKRRTRNLSEKKRRDQFNSLVNELSSLVSSNTRKMDKSTVLKSTISFLKNHNEIIHRSRAHDVNEDCKPAFLSNDEFTYLVLEALEGFIMVFSSNGQIFYVSENISPLLGHSPGDVLNKSILEFAFEEDRQNMYNLLQNPTMAKDRTQSTGKENEIRFQCHLRRGTMNTKDEPTYELIQFNGHFRSSIEDSEVEDIRTYQHDPDTRLMFLCTGRLCTPQLIRDVSLVDKSHNEFTSRHSLEWKFLFLDHRAPPIIGYLPFEVLGTSGYDYYHFDDLEKVVSCHEVLMQKGELTSCYYRFLTKGQQWIWLQTRFFITYHQWNSKPEFVVCTHRVVSYADLAKRMKPKVEEMDTASKADTSRSSLNGSRSEDFAPSASPSYMSETSDNVTHTYHDLSRPPSMSGSRTVASSSASWPRPSHVRYNDSDNGSTSGFSISSHRNSTREARESARGGMIEMDQDQPQGMRTLSNTVDNMEDRRHSEVRCMTRSPTVLTMDSDGSGDGRAITNSNACLVPQHGMGTQYLDPTPFVGAMSVPGVMQLPIAPLPIIVGADQAQVQLQRKHEELQQMLVRQQEELRQVKEQLLLARLGILQPLITVPNPHGSPEEGQMNQRVPAQILYTESPPRTPGTFPQQHPPNNQGHHPHMPQ